MTDKDRILSEEEIAIRMNNAVRRALNTPPKPLKEITRKSKRKPASEKKNPEQSDL